MADDYDEHERMIKKGLEEGHLFMLYEMLAMDRTTVKMLLDANESQRSYIGERRSQFRWEFLSLLLLLLGLFGSTYVFPNVFHTEEVPRSDLPQRIELLTKSLAASAKTVGQIEQEVSKRQELVGRLMADAETATKLAAINREQAEAIANTLRGELRKEEQHNFWNKHLELFSYTVLGAILAEIAHFITTRIRRRRENADG
jgi:hypothetical protein